MLRRPLTSVSIALLIATAGWQLFDYPQPVLSQGDWHQPAAASRYHPEPMAPLHPKELLSTEATTNRWTFNFAPLEEQIATSLAGRRSLKLDDNLLRQFQSAFQALPTPLTSASLQRMELLLRKSFPEPAGGQLAQLIGPLYRYHLALETESLRLAERYPTGSFAASAALFEVSENLQQRHFSPDQIQQLFGRANALSRYLLERRRVREDPDLSLEQKRVALRGLQESLKVSR